MTALDTTEGLLNVGAASARSGGSAKCERSLAVACRHVDRQWGHDSGCARARQGPTPGKLKAP